MQATVCCTRGDVDHRIPTSSRRQYSHTVQRRHALLKFVARCDSSAPARQQQSHALSIPRHGMHTQRRRKKQADTRCLVIVEHGCRTVEVAVWHCFMSRSTQQQNSKQVRRTENKSKHRIVVLHCDCLEIVYTSIYTFYLSETDCSRTTVCRLEELPKLL